MPVIHHSLFNGVDLSNYGFIRVPEERDVGSSPDFVNSSVERQRAKVTVRPPNEHKHLTFLKELNCFVLFSTHVAFLTECSR